MSKPVLTRRLEKLCAPPLPRSSRLESAAVDPPDYVPDRSAPRTATATATAMATGTSSASSRLADRWRTAAGLTILATLAAVAAVSAIGRIPPTGTAALGGREIARSQRIAEAPPRRLDLATPLELPVPSHPLLAQDDHLASERPAVAVSDEPYRRTADALTADEPVPPATLAVAPLPSDGPAMIDGPEGDQPATDETRSARERVWVLQLLAQARADIQQGKFAEARSKVDEARRLGMEDAAGPDSPQAVLAELERIETASAGPSLDDPSLEERVPVLPDQPANERDPYDHALPLLTIAPPSEPVFPAGPPAEQTLAEPEPTLPDVDPAPASAETAVALDRGPFPWDQALRQITDESGVVMQVYRLTPRVQNADVVELEIIAEPSAMAPGEAPSASLHPRQAVRTTVTLRSGQTVRLGGFTANGRAADSALPVPDGQHFLLLTPHAVDAVPAALAPLDQPGYGADGMDIQPAAPPREALVDGPRIIPGPRRRHALSADSPRDFRTE